MRYRAKKGHFSRFNRARVYTRESKAFKGCLTWCYYAALFVPISHGCGVWCVWSCFVLSCDCGGVPFLWWRYAFRVTVCRCGRCGRSSRWCGGVSVSVRGAAVRSCFLRSRRSSRVRARVYALASCIRAPAYTRPLCAREKQVRGVIPPFRVQKNFIGVKMCVWVCEKALTSAI